MSWVPDIFRYGGRAKQPLVDGVALRMSPPNIKAKVVTFTGALTATSTVTVPAPDGADFVFENATTGAQNVVVNGPSGGGVTVLPGQRRSIIIVDGNIVDIATLTTLPGPLAGEVTGAYTSTIVSKIANAAAPPPSPAATGPETNRLLMAASSTALMFAMLTDANVSATAAIAGSKIVPNFGAQAVVAASAQLTGLASGVVRSSAGSLVVGSVTGADIAIAGQVTGDLLTYNGTAWARLPVGNGGQVLTMVGGVPAWAAAGAVTWAGDLAGSTNTTQVTARLNGITAPASAPGSAGQFLVSSSVSALTYRVLAAADIPAAASIALTGDVTGTSGANTVALISAATGTLKWAATYATPTLTQTTLAGTGATAGVALLIQAQAGQQQTGTAANNDGGEVRLVGGAAGTGGTGAAGKSGPIAFWSGATRAGSVTAGFGYMYFQSDALIGGINFDASANTAGQFFMTSGLTSGAIYITTPSIIARDAAQTTTLTWGLASAGATTLTVASTVVSYTLNHASATGLLQWQLNGTTYLAIGAFNGSSAGVLQLGNVTTAPTTNPTGGGLFYTSAGALMYRGSSGTVTTLAPA